LKSPDDNYRKALQYAFLLLRYRDRSEREIIQRLQRKGFDDDTGRSVAGYLKEKGFVDDSRFAESLIKSAIEQKHLGRKGVAQLLHSKGIPREIIQGIPDDDDRYIGAARILVEKKIRQWNGLDETTREKRIWAALARKGYSTGIIGRVLRQYFSEEGIET
jgi:regulatory protein